MSKSRGTSSEMRFLSFFILASQSLLLGSLPFNVMASSKKDPTEEKTEQRNEESLPLPGTRTPNNRLVEFFSARDGRLQLLPSFLRSSIPGQRSNLGQDSLELLSLNPALGPASRMSLERELLNLLNQDPAFMAFADSYVPEAVQRIADRLRTAKTEHQSRGEVFNSSHFREELVNILLLMTPAFDPEELAGTTTDVNSILRAIDQLNLDIADVLQSSSTVVESFQSRINRLGTGTVEISLINLETQVQELTHAFRNFSLITTRTRSEGSQADSSLATQIESLNLSLQRSANLTQAYLKVARQIYFTVQILEELNPKADRWMRELLGAEDYSASAASILTLLREYKDFYQLRLYIFLASINTLNDHSTISTKMNQFLEVLRHTETQVDLAEGLQNAALEREKKILQTEQIRFRAIVNQLRPHEALTKIALEDWFRDPEALLATIKRIHSELKWYQETGTIDSLISTMTLFIAALSSEERIADHPAVVLELAEILIIKESVNPFPKALYNLGDDKRIITQFPMMIFINFDFKIWQKNPKLFLDLIQFLPVTAFPEPGQITSVTALSNLQRLNAIYKNLLTYSPASHQIVFDFLTNPKTPIFLRPADSVVAASKPPSSFAIDMQETATPTGFSSKLVNFCKGIHNRFSRKRE